MQVSVGSIASIDIVKKQENSNTSIKAFKRCLKQLDQKDRKLEMGEQIRIEASEILELEYDATKIKPPIASQTQNKFSTPSSSLNPLLSLSHGAYGLPEALIKNFTSLGVKSIYPWQSACLRGSGLLTGEKNLVYTAPTGGGKSLVADVLMLKRIVENPLEKAILVLPYVALVQEKLKWLRKLVDGVSRLSNSNTQPDFHRAGLRKHRNDGSIRVAGFFGGSKTRAGWSDIDIAVCTIEKANSLVNVAIEQCTIDDLGIVVLDELHMIDDHHRGYLMELMATKLLTLQRSVQIVGMSATLSNIPLLATWLGAKYYVSQYKPVPIQEYLVFDYNIFRAPTSSVSNEFLRTSNPIRRIQNSSNKALKNPLTNAVVSLAIETVRAGFGALIFCSARQWCQVMATLVGEAMPPTPDGSEEIMDRRKEIISELRSLSVGLEETLGKTIVRGVAYHHAGMTTEEREIVANAYDKGTISVIVATCSLAAGINLPARRVIIQGVRMGHDIIGPAMLRQMCGRAGRKGKDEIGESYLCCQETDLKEITQLLETELPSIKSSLTPEKRGIKRALLEVIAVRLARQANAIQEYTQRTLLSHTMDQKDLSDFVDSTIDDLITSQLITADDAGCYEATRLGQAIVASSLTPEDGLFLYGELQRALQAFVMDGDMHIFYTFTPIHSSSSLDIDWSIFRREMENLDESGLRVLRFVGINPAFVNNMALSARPLPERTAEESRVAQTYRRFYTAFQLRDLCNEVPVHVVARNFAMPRGFVQNLAQSCEGFAAGMIQFCDKLGWGMLKSALEHMTDRLKAGAKADLLELAKIPYVKSRTARIFWENGLKSLMAVAEADPTDVSSILLLAQPGKSKYDRGVEVKYHRKLLLKAEIIVAAASRLWERQQQVDIEADM